MIDPAAFSLETQRWLAAGAVALAYAGFCAAIAGREAGKRRRARQAAQALTAGAGEPVLVAYASQTGLAEELALATAKALQAGDVPVRLRDLARVDAADLIGVRRALFVVSTTGEGDSPDSARRFIRTVMADTVNL
jgi:sulfite reductase (NADPH) flavoprotein alpha-component